MSPQSHAERQRRYRERHTASRDAILRMLLEIKADLASLRDVVVTLVASSRDEKPESRDAKSAKSSTYAEKPPSPRKRGLSLLDSNWILSLREREFAQSLGLDPDRTADKFRDYWLAKTGKDAMKADWSATWRNWCRNEQDFGRRGGAPPAAQTSPLPPNGSPALNEFRAKQLADLARKGINVLPGSML